MHALWKSRLELEPTDLASQDACSPRLGMHEMPVGQKRGRVLSFNWEGFTLHRNHALAATTSSSPRQLHQQFQSEGARASGTIWPKVKLL